MKVAVAVTENKEVNAHFGHTENFLIYNVEGDKIDFVEVRKNLIKKTNGHFHEALVSLLKDVDTVIAGGIGRGAYSNLIAEDKKVVITSIGNVEEAIKKLVKGELEHEADRIHSHGHDHTHPHLNNAHHHGIKEE